MIRQLLTAVLLAAVVIAVLVVVTRLVTVMAFGVTVSAPPPASYLVINILASMVAAGLGGYLCAQRAPEGRVTLASFILVVLFLGAGVWVSRAAATPYQPLWFQSLATLLGVSGLFCGLVIGTSQRARV